MTRNPRMGYKQDVPDLSDLDHHHHHHHHHHHDGSLLATVTGDHDGYMIENLESAVSPFHKQRRKRRPWADSEIQALRAGVAKHGEGCWVDILKDLEFTNQFDQRNKYDLKDKWRNLTAYKPYSERRVRRYVLLNANHETILTENGHPHYFNNRWPRDAALKVSSRSEFYPPGENEIDIYLREVATNKDGSSSSHLFQPLIVHVYKGTREKRSAINIQKFQNKKFMWVPRVVKVREEKYSLGKLTNGIPHQSQLPMGINLAGLAQM